MTSIRYIVSNFDQSVRQIISDINSWIANYDNGLIVGTVSEDDWWDIYLTLYGLNILYSYEILYTTSDMSSKIIHAIEELIRLHGDFGGA